MYIQGIDVVLYTTEQIGVDEFDAPIYEETPKTVSNVLVGQPTSEEVLNDFDLMGKRLAYTLYIPKGDENDWNDKTVEFFGEKFKTYGHVTQYIEHLVPLSWNKQIKVERYE